MDYEQKYKDALERAKVINPGTADYEVAVKIFPELKESKDEKIRKAILELVEQSSHVLNPMNQKSMIAWLKKQEGHIHIRKELFEHLKQSWYKEGFMDGKYSGVSFEYNGHTWGMCARDNGVDILLDKQLFKHLEKQGEQEPTDKIEPKQESKFKTGTYIVYLNDTYMLEDDGKHYILTAVKKNTSTPVIHIPYGYEDYTMREWNIADAKDGDVLASKNKCPFIYKACKESDTKSHFYCCVSINNNFYIGDDISYCGYKESSKPATKEQRDLLFYKMKEAGYEWDVEKKELKKIEQNPNEWSEEDEKNVNTILNLIRDSDMSAQLANKLSSWLKSLNTKKYVKYIDAEKLKTKIDRLIKKLEPVHPHFAPFVNGRRSAFKDCLNLIDSLQKEHEIYDNIDILKGE